MMSTHAPVPIKRLHPDAHDLRRGSCDAAGIDVAYCGEEVITIYPGQTLKLATGWAFQLPSYVAMLILPRSGMATKKKVRPINTPGLLDADYRGELFVALEHAGIEGTDKPVTIEPGDYIAQIMLVPYYKPMFQLTNELSSTERGEGGFGSTDQPKVEG